MKPRKFEIKFKRYTDYDCVVEATSHAKAKMRIGYSLMDCGYFKKFGDVLREISTCRSLEPMKCGRKPFRKINQSKVKTVAELTQNFNKNA